MELIRINGHGHHTLGIDDTGDSFIPIISKYISKDPQKRGKQIEWFLNNIQSVFFWSSKKKLKKLSNYLDTIDNTSEERLLEDLSYHDLVVCIITDLHYQGAGKCNRDYEDQIKEAIYLKEKYGDRVLLFMMLDPNRPNLLELVEKYHMYMDGWKLYPTWYFVTDKRLRPIFDNHPKPVMVHCTDSSPVYWQGDRDYLKKALGPLYCWWKSKEENCKQFSHPRYILRMAHIYTNIAWSACHYGGDNEEYRELIQYNLNFNVFTDDAYTFDTLKENEELVLLAEQYGNTIHGSDYFMTKTEEDYSKTVSYFYNTIPEWIQKRMQDSFYRFITWR